MQTSTTVKSQILAGVIQRAEVQLTVNKTVDRPNDTRTEQQKAVDRFFSRRRFCEHHDSALELVGLLMGRTVMPELKHGPSDFSILYCNHNKVPWIVLSDERGFAGVERACYHVDFPACERYATQAESRQFIDEVLKKTDPELFFAWVKEKIAKTDWMLDL